jgi:hypothetical protein
VRKRARRAGPRAPPTQGRKARQKERKKGLRPSPGVHEGAHINEDHRAKPDTLSRSTRAARRRDGDSPPAPPARQPASPDSGGRPPAPCALSLPGRSRTGDESRTSGGVGPPPSSSPEALSRGCVPLPDTRGRGATAVGKAAWPWPWLGPGPAVVHILSGLAPGGVRVRARGEGGVRSELRGLMCKCCVNAYLHMYDVLMLNDNVWKSCC